MAIEKELLMSTSQSPCATTGAALSQLKYITYNVLSLINTSWQQRSRERNTGNPAARSKDWEQLGTAHGCAIWGKQ
eukprot:3486155-Rhodomonas_salina.1